MLEFSPMANKTNEQIQRKKPLIKEPQPTKPMVNPTPKPLIKPTPIPNKKSIND